MRRINNMINGDTQVYSSGMVSHLGTNTYSGLGYQYTYKHQHITIRFILPLKGHRGWFTCYISKNRIFSENELYDIPGVIITYDGMCSTSWGRSSLWGEKVIGWDYAHDIEEESLKSVRDVFRRC